MGWRMARWGGGMARWGGVGYMGWGWLHGGAVGYMGGYLDGDAVGAG